MARLASPAPNQWRASSPDTASAARESRWPVPTAFRRLECLRYRLVEALPSTGQQFPVNDFPECGMAECNCPVAPYFHHMLIQGRSEQGLRFFDKHPDRCRQQVYRCRAADYRC